MTTSLEFLKVRLLPASFFGRLFGALIAVSLTLLLTAGWFFSRHTYDLLDREAGHQLSLLAQNLGAELALTAMQNGHGEAVGRFRQRTDQWRTMDWIHNVYWADLRENRPRFLAAYSIATTSVAAAETLNPPTAEDLEDLLDETLSTLEDNKPAFPRPFFGSSSRRYKIVLVPLLDADGLLESVVGIEADLQYLDLFQSTRRSFLRALSFGIPICFLLSLLMARSFSRRVERLLDDLRRVTEPTALSEALTGIREFDALKLGINQLQRTIQARDAQLNSLHEEKLQDLSFTGAAIAHEIRNPLSAIEMHLGLIRRRYSPTGEDVEAFQEIQEQLAHLKSLVEQFLTYSRKVEMQPEPLALEPFLADLLETRKTTHPTLGFRLEIADPGTAYLDPAMFRSIMENLINNALDARPRDLELRITATFSDQVLTLHVADNGPGIPADLLPRLFTPFVTGKTGGHGIGLALIRKLTEAHHGRISCSSTSSGTVFRLEFPLAPVQPCSAAQAATPTTEGTPP
jgi:signal transduction histidine kinase